MSALLVAACASEVGAPGANAGPQKDGTPALTEAIPAGESPTMLWLENDQLKVGLSLDWGGSITFMARKADGKLGDNLIDQRDPGRLLQCSFYASGETYKNATGLYEDFGWNPVQGGDKYGHGSVLLGATVNESGTEAAVEVQPLQWSPDHEVNGELQLKDGAELADDGKPRQVSDVVLYWTVKLDEQGIIVYTAVENKGPTRLEANNQECPVAFVTPPYNDELFFQNGTAETPVVDPQREVKDGDYEFWSADRIGFMGSRGGAFGLTIFTPKGTFLPREAAATAPADGRFLAHHWLAEQEQLVGYFRPIQTFGLPGQATTYGKFFVAAGGWEEGRAWVERHRDRF